jgi:hypothetical protein
MLYPNLLGLLPSSCLCPPAGFLVDENRAFPTEPVAK